MSNKLRKIFCPTTEEQVNQLEQLKKDIQSIPNGDCTNCKYYISPDPTLPGFVTDYGGCSKNIKIFYTKKYPCYEYEKNTELLKEIDIIISNLTEGSDND